MDRDFQILDDFLKIFLLLFSFFLFFFIKQEFSTFFFSLEKGRGSLIFSLFENLKENLVSRFFFYKKGETFVF